jgi:hypothetical protein
MNLEKRINAFVQLGLFLKQFQNNKIDLKLSFINTQFYDVFEELIERQKAYNGWFTKENVVDAIDSIANSLSSNELNNWLSNYKMQENTPKTIGVIMAGNIPLVGFHDFLCVLITGNKIQAKLSSGDNTLIKKVAEILIFIDVDFSNKIEFVERLENFDAVIATGSNNTARYFNQYFGKYPHIIRKNRNSVAIIHKDDGIKEIEPLGNDIFQYFGLGCRSVSKLYFPKGYKIDTFFEAIYNHKEVTNNNKYANNYDYNKAVYLLGSNQLLDNGFLLLKEDDSLASPVGVLNYEFYNSAADLQKHLKEINDELQCVVSSKNNPISVLNFGDAQCPTLIDYADGVDTIKFLLELS